MSSHTSSQTGDKKADDTGSEDPSHPGMNPDYAERGSRQRVGGEHSTDALHFTQEELHPGMNPDYAERGKELGEENAFGGHSVGTGGHGKSNGGSSRQRIGGEHSMDMSQFTEEEQHPGMNPDPAARGAELGRENAQGGHSVGTGGHGATRTQISQVRNVQDQLISYEDPVHSS
ncbi:unnamed protein product [Rotaria sp. Silwood1]|nr:unnamed protein product [Rotaria sp. Silwood1]CAF1623050.1 unnamed protein product [Rotaria sp. Silwood1]